MNNKMMKWIDERHFPTVRGKLKIAYQCSDSAEVRAELKEIFHGLRPEYACNLVDERTVEKETWMAWRQAIEEECMTWEQKDEAGYCPPVTD